MSDDRPLCVLSHRDDKPQNVDVGFLCRWHRGRLDSTVCDIRTDWFDLALILEAGSAPKDTAPKTRHMKSASPPAPANLDALVLRDPRTHAAKLPKVQQDGKPTDMSKPIPAVLTIVASWVLLVADERPLTTVLPSSVIAQLDLLTRHGDWIAAQPWIDDYYLEISELRKALKTALRDKSSVRIGSCYLPTADDQACGGALLRENGSATVKCFRCRSAWTTPQELARLQLALEGKVA
jgi:hypothetical protein